MSITTSHPAPAHPPRSNGRSILISGASIAGTTLAYWLHSYGFAVTVVERSATIRLGGYPIDVRGSAIEVSERMGLADQLEAAGIHTSRLTFVDANGENGIAIAPEIVTGGRVGRDVEVPRGALTSMIYDLTREVVDYRFGISIVSLSDGDAGVDVTLSDGTTGRFDIVLGADGLHSNVRGLAFGPEARFDRHIGFCFAGFDVPNTFGLSHEGIVSNRPGRMVTLFAPGTSDRVHVLFAFAHPPLTREQGRDLAFQHKLVAETFADWGWFVPELLVAMRRADDLFFDEVMQIKLPAYSAGRVALAGDAGYAPSFLTGQGSSLALAGAYVLASELALHANHTDAFAAYELAMRPFVEVNHATVAEGAASMLPMTDEAIEGRNRYLTSITEPPAAEGRDQYGSLDLSRYLGIAAS